MPGEEEGGEGEVKGGLGAFLYSTVSPSAKAAWEALPLQQTSHAAHDGKLSAGSINLTQDHALYAYPASVANSPLMILTHGGSFVNQGDAYLLSQFAEQMLAETKCAVLNVCFPPAKSSGQSAWPQVEAVKAALEWAEEHAALLKINPARVVLFGTSTGGWLAHRAAQAINEAAGSKKVKLAASFSGPTHLLPDCFLPSGITSEAAWAMGVTAKEAQTEPTPEAVVAADKHFSPIYNIVPATSPDILVVASAEENVVPHTNANEMQAAAEAQGATEAGSFAVSRLEVPGTTHVAYGGRTITAQVFGLGVKTQEVRRFVSDAINARV